MSSIKTEHDHLVNGLSIVPWNVLDQLTQEQMRALDQTGTTRKLDKGDFVFCYGENAASDPRATAHGGGEGDGGRGAEEAARISRLATPVDAAGRDRIVRQERESEVVAVHPAGGHQGRVILVARSYQPKST